MVLPECLGVEVKPTPIQVSQKTVPFLQTIDHTYAFLSSVPETRQYRKFTKAANQTRKLNWKLPGAFVPLAIDVSNTHNTSKLDQRTGNDSEIVDKKPQGCLLNWSKEQRNDLLGSFFYGYALSQVPAARVAEIFGAKPLFLFVGFGASLCSLLFPLAAKYQDSMVFAFLIRVLLGATQGAMFPAIYVFFCQWLPKNERPKWLPFPSAFSRFGTIAMMLIVPLILEKCTWEAVFYATGGAALIWCIIFIVFASSTPQTNYWISSEELAYIESHMEPKTQDLTKSSIVTASGFSINESSSQANKKPSINWFKMLTNKAVLVMALVMFTAEWSNAILLIKLPDYLESVFGMSTKEIGFWSSIMIGIFCFSYPASGWLANKLDNSSIEWLTPLRVRKLFELLANSLQAIGCILIAYNFDKTLVLGSLFLMMVGRSIVGGGQCLMPPELSKDYPGTVFAYSNTIANMAGILAPRSVTWMVDNPTQHDSWFYFYIMSAVIFVVGAIIFCAFAENRPHNYSKKPKFKPNLSISQAQLHKVNMEPEEIFKMEAFPKLASEKKASKNQTRL